MSQKARCSLEKSLQLMQCISFELDISNAALFKLQDAYFENYWEPSLVNQFC